MDTDWDKPRLIRNLETSIRLQNIMEYNGIKTVDEAMNIPKWKYYTYRNMGKKSMIELEKHLREFPEFSNSLFNTSFSIPKPEKRQILSLMKQYDLAINERERATKRMEEVECSMRMFMEKFFESYMECLRNKEVMK